MTALNPILTTKFVAAAAAAAVLMIGGCRRAEPGQSNSATARAPAAPEPIDVDVARVTIQPVDRTVEVTGSLFAFEDTLISPKLSERVVRVTKDFGDVVAQGEVLAELDATDARLLLEERQSQVAAALAKLGLSSLPTGDIDVEKLPAVARARAQAQNAQARLDRARRLFEQTPPLLSEQDYADIRTESDVAFNQANVEVMNARAALADAKALASAVQTAEQRLADTIVRAPTMPDKPEMVFRVAERLASVGAFVTEGRAMYRLVVSDPVRYRAQVPDRFAGQVRVGQVASVFATEEAGRPGLAGKLERVWPVVDPESRSFVAEVLLPNPSGDLKPGAFAKGTIVLRRDEGARFVPEQAVWSFAGLNRVFAIKDGKAVEHRVQLGVRRDGLVEILTPLASDVVAVSGVTGLTAGAPVRTREAPAGGSPAKP